MQLENPLCVCTSIPWESIPFNKVFADMASRPLSYYSPAFHRLPCRRQPSTSPWQRLLQVYPSIENLLLFRLRWLGSVAHFCFRVESVPSSNAMARLCLDNGLGPVSCLRDSDFTLTFEQSILSILPACLFLLLAPIRLVQLWRKPVVTARNELRLFKLVIASHILISMSSTE